MTDFLLLVVPAAVCLVVGLGLLGRAFMDYLDDRWWKQNGG
jgi:hypothetical protein